MKTPRLVSSWRQKVRNLTVEVYAIYLACRDPRVPWHARAFAACVAAYAFSPIDLIPDPIPVLGYLDDLILVPLGIWLALKMIPADVLQECRLRARDAGRNGGPGGRAAAAVIVAVWLIAGAWIGMLILRMMEKS
ncbi:MAG: hypothetical protein A4E73_00378 [Syntrophaceae bacterium PtaU1.Bin231]|nr:MAG: hypothetical protein A4E73_00378 [Syntrophaceae bacterium PtaU1.Bin231]